jgi:hypothetical protein
MLAENKEIFAATHVSQVQPIIQASQSNQDFDVLACLLVLGIRKILLTCEN